MTSANSQLNTKTLARQLLGLPQLLICPWIFKYQCIHWW